MTSAQRIPPVASFAPAVCAWCVERIPEGVVPVVIAQRNLHPHCAGQFDAWVDSRDDTRWNAVTDDTPVLFEGELCQWGSLMLADRKTCEMRSDGSLVGGYPI